MSEQRLIDANVLTDFCRGLRKELHGKYKEYTPTIYDTVEFNARDNMLLNFEQMVGIQPEIDAVPVVRGEWIAEQKDAEYCEFRCSACDESVGQTDQFDETEVKQFSEWYKYCPTCGARMDGAE